MIVFIIAMILEIIFDQAILVIPTVVVGFIWSMKTNNNMMSYIEKHAFDGKNNEQNKSDKE